MEFKVITKAPKASFAKVEDQNHADHIKKQGVIRKEFVPKG
jgi:hypothetical protein